MSKTYSSNCICALPKQSFAPLIVYRDESVFKNYEGLVIARCQNCGMLKTLAVDKKTLISPEISEVEHYEENRIDFQKGFAKLVSRIKLFKSKGSVLDVGASSGIFMQVLESNGYTVFGIEPNKKAFEVLKKQFDTDVYHGYLKDFQKRNKITFDLVVYNHVLEHIEDPNMEFEVIKKVLKKNGLLVIGVPNTDNLIFKIRNKYWEYLLPGQHIWHFSKEHLSRLLMKEGFKIIDVSFNNDRRSDYPFFKKIYFRTLSCLNALMGTGEAITIIATR